jgi:small subunit ribosomal protein S7
MSRRRKAQTRVVLPDPKFQSRLITEFIGVLMKDGKKTIAEKIIYTAIDELNVKVEGEESPIEKFEAALENIKPHLEVKSRRVGGATYQVPIEVHPKRSKALALRWLVDAAIKRSEHTMSQRLTNELVAAHKSEGNAVRKRVDTHKMADANKAFAHFRW